ncbi:MAG TPA: hypothetical protein VM344_04975 [Vitreimonas sp.]|nr:hypothetical protein [Vitreimonas sp.]
MTSRTITTAVAGRSSSMRRLRRRAGTVRRLYCQTNGCASLLSTDASGRRATCGICGYTRRLD